ncbi:amidotransferase 1, exosortase A system-associated [Thalassotalea sp. M1531]|uniref:asparagine synthase (glutamine-hydrolyzing) n=1 Tax=Thalassotalea algicola TaxID=2716224 RepID=A0A7Y0Q7G7_9GAMM|nr:XrtA/PEP-CTERM system amidotransferase [Thalassotalea algicola]NMP33064.1 amidotransferase 1, exosortase A system-associated [Thalassotalea algicola]
MCGIAGIFHSSNEVAVEQSLIQSMNDRQKHRGPNAGDYYFADGLALAHRRLSIIDLEGSPQPMTSACGKAVIVFNGEIYNFKGLHEELKSKGYRFNTVGDTETILNAYLEWGEECVSHLRGMFAFTIWDLEKEKLFIARDRLGIKPFYYSILDGTEFIFGSELKVLTEHPKLDKTINELAVEDFFALGYIPDPKSIFKSVHKLPPGHTLTIDRVSFKAEVKQYWDATFAKQSNESFESLQEELIEKLKEAVDIRMVAEVPLGAFLSGGVDSSAIVALMANLSKDPVNTCSIGFDVKNFNETEFAEMVADRYKTNHEVKTVASDDFDLIDTLVGVYDEPFADSSAIPTYRVCQMAAEQVTVCLSGDGGDELFAGYRRHRWHMLEEKIRQFVPHSLRKPVFGFLGKYYPKLDWAPKFLRAKSTFQALQRNSIEAYLHSVSVTTDELRDNLFNNKFKQKLAGYQAISVFNEHAKNFDGKDPLSLIQYIDMKTYLPGDILTKVDRASMAHSLEVRVPIIDHKFLEWSNTIPAKYKLVDREGKFVFKKSLEKHLPEDVLYRDKMGFGVPVSKWFRGPLKESLRQRVLHGKLVELDIFNQVFLTKIVEEHISGVKEHSAVLWSLMMFEGFLTNMLGKSEDLAA